MSASLTSRFAPSPAGYQNVTAEEIAPILAELRRIDVREPHEHTAPQGRVPGSELVPLATVAEQAKSWDRSRPLLVFCRSGVRSASAASTLVSMGFTQVYNLQGGMLRWSELGLPVDR